MIYDLKLTNEFTNGILHYIWTNEDCSDIRNLLQKGIEFKDGLNILVGKNGSGKSTILNIIRYLTFCEGGFSSELNADDLDTRFHLGDNKNLYKSFEMKADYNNLIFNLYSMRNDSSRSNNSVLKDRNTVLQFMDLQTKSNGQNQMGDLSQLIHIMFKKQNYNVNQLIYKFDKKRNSDVFEEELNLAKKFYKDNQKDSNRVTILMDEVDQGLDIENLEDIYEMLSANREDTQLIVSLHNIALIQKLKKLPFVNIIEVSKGYLNKIENFLTI